MSDVDIRSHLAFVRQRREMFGIDWRYRSAVAYVQGCDAGTGGQLLKGLNDWMQQRIGAGRSIAWWGQLVHQRYPELKKEGRRYSDLTRDESECLIDDLFDAVDTFLAERGAKFVIERNSVDVHQSTQ
jgi:hypothetical protein